MSEVTPPSFFVWLEASFLTVLPPHQFVAFYKNCYRVECGIVALGAMIGSIVIESSEILIELQWLVASYLCSGFQGMFLRPE
jgi:hypothetical protein